MEAHFSVGGYLPAGLSVLSLGYRHTFQAQGIGESLATVHLGHDGHHFYVGKRVYAPGQN